MNSRHYLRRLGVSLSTTLALMTASAQRTLTAGFDHPQDTARTKVWWFHGETEASHAGITADLEAFRKAGVGGVVYYDQVHGDGQGASQVFSPEWWDELTFSAQEARRLGLSFEVNCSNGYVAGGKWITPERSMQRLAMAETIYQGGTSINLPLPHCPQGWHQDVAVLAVRYNDNLLGDSRIWGTEPTETADSLLYFDFGKTITARSITYEVTAQGKARTSSMQVPPTHTPLAQPDPTRFYGCGFRELPDIGVLEVSDDGSSYRKVCLLHARYQNLGGVKQQTVAFPTVKGRFFRIRVVQNPQERHVRLSNIIISARARVDRWEEKASLVSEFITSDNTPIYNKEEIICADSIIDLTDRMTADGTLTWRDAPQGKWLVMRFVSVSTGGHTKHGRKEALGLECDKLSVEGARLQWRCYVQPVIDSIRVHGGSLEGVCMDSHEAGPQNWTVGFEKDFLRLRGYDIKRLLPTLADGIIIHPTNNIQPATLLKDFRRTISDLVTDCYYGEMNRLCHANGLTLTAQAIGGALCMAGDAIEVKKGIDKPQGEFWGYQTEGNYDIKDCASAAHLYGKQIASGEAFTDITYRHSLADIKNLADYAYAYGINELVVCASAYQNQTNASQRPTLSTANGRQYVLNRMNTLWPLSRPFWDYQARCSWMMRQGKPVSDVCIYLGDEVPMRTMAHRLPNLPQGFDFDACTTDALLHRLMVKDGRLMLPDGVGYRLLILPADETLTEEVRQRIDGFRQQGALVYDPSTDKRSLPEMLDAEGILPDVETTCTTHLYHTHRQTATEDIYFLNNHSDETAEGRFIFHTQHRRAELWNPVTGRRNRIHADVTKDGRISADLTLHPREAYFIVFSHEEKGENATQPYKNVRQETTISINGPWRVQFDTTAGGPSKPVTFNTLTDWTHHPDAAIRYYSGTATYTNTFKLKKKEDGMTYQLIFDSVGSAAQVLINGKEAGIVWCSPWKVDITPFIKKGKNKVEIRVANCLWNRLVGDADREENERLMRQTTPIAKPTDELVPSGIVGNVIIKGSSCTF